MYVGLWTRTDFVNLVVWLLHYWCHNVILLLTPHLSPSPTMKSSSFCRLCFCRLRCRYCGNSSRNCCSGVEHPAVSDLFAECRLSEIMYKLTGPKLQYTVRKPYILLTWRTGAERCGWRQSQPVGQASILLSPCLKIHPSSVPLTHTIPIRRYYVNRYYATIPIILLFVACRREAERNGDKASQSGKHLSPSKKIHPSSIPLSATQTLIGAYFYLNSSDSIKLGKWWSSIHFISCNNIECYLHFIHKHLKWRL